VKLGITVTSVHMMTPDLAIEDGTTDMILTDGGSPIGEGIWTKDGNQWFVKTTATLRDGKRVAATTIMTQIDGDTLNWQSKDGTMDGTLLPEMQEGKMKRLK
jgi:hypothetical protein